MKKLILLLILPFTVNAGNLVTSMDEDGDGIQDYAIYAQEDDGLYGEGYNDTCVGVRDDFQWISPNWNGEGDPVGSACDYDIDGDGKPATISDYNALKAIVEASNGEILMIPRLGDLTRGVTVSGNELFPAGWLNEADICALAMRNPQLYEQVKTDQIMTTHQCKLLKVIYGL